MDNKTKTSERSIDFLKEFDRLVKLFRDDRFGFERERKRLLEEVIAGSPSEKSRDNLRALQENWNRVMRGAGSNQNRLVMSHVLLQDHVANVHIPTLRACKLKTPESEDSTESPVLISIK
jgi:hypothetical protein